MAGQRVDRAPPNNQKGGKRRPSWGLHLKFAEGKEIPEPGRIGEKKTST